MLNSDENRTEIIALFPGLEHDKDFKITDKPNPNYNCIAWAACVDDAWWWALPLDKRPAYLDGVKYDWPFDAVNDTKLNTFVGIFTKLKYVPCDNGDYEDGFRKICIYGNSPDDVQHAARQFNVGKYKGVWTSKLGQGFKINHSTAYSIEGDIYGKVLQFMKCQWP
jgi:hypothetical protein